MPLAQLAGHRVWVPGIVPGTEWAAYYDDLVAEFGLTIEIVVRSDGARDLRRGQQGQPVAGRSRPDRAGLSRGSGGRGRVEELLEEELVL